MKKILLSVIVFLICWISASADEEYDFSYDCSGDNFYKSYPTFLMTTMQFEENHLNNKELAGERIKGNVNISFSTEFLDCNVSLNGETELEYDLLEVKETSNPSLGILNFEDITDGTIITVVNNKQGRIITITQENGHFVRFSNPLSTEYYDKCFNFLVSGLIRYEHLKDETQKANPTDNTSTTQYPHNSDYTPNRDKPTTSSNTTKSGLSQNDLPTSGELSVLTFAEHPFGFMPTNVTTKNELISELNRVGWSFNYSDPIISISPSSLKNGYTLYGKEISSLNGNIGRNTSLFFYSLSVSESKIIWDKNDAKNFFNKIRTELESNGYIFEKSKKKYYYYRKGSRKITLTFDEEKDRYRIIMTVMPKS